MSLADQPSSPSQAGDLYGHDFRLIQPHLFLVRVPPNGRPSRRPRSSSGPWLRVRFCCPVASLLTMTTSEALAPRHGLLFIPVASRSTAPQAPELPPFTLPVLRRVPSAIPRRFWKLRQSILFHFQCGFHPRWTDSATAGFGPFPSRPGGISRLHSSLHAAARVFVRPAPARTFTIELAPPVSPPNGVDYH